MAVSLVQTNFTGGELSPKLKGRVDLARYQDSAETLLNCRPTLYGGVVRREGTAFIASTKDSTKQSLLVPFVFSRAQAYILEFGDGYMRVYMDGGQVQSGGSPYEITTPYTEAMLPTLNYTQGADTMLLFHEEVPIYRMRRFGHTDWRLEEAPFTVAPFDEQGVRPDISLTLSAATVGINRTATASATYFLPADINRHIVVDGGLATITQVISTTQVRIDITYAFLATTYAAGLWLLDGSPFAPCTASAVGPVGSSITLTLGNSNTTSAPGTITALSGNGNGTATATVTAHGYSNGDTVNVTGCLSTLFNVMNATISGVTANTFTYPISSRTSIAATQLGTVTKVVVGSAGGWRGSDVGSHVQINGGLVEITGITSDIIARATVKKVLSSVTAAQSGAWTVEQDVWSETNGYPRAGTLCGQRLYAAGSPGYPQAVWASEIGDVLNFTLWTADDDAFSFTIDSDQINPITHLAQNKKLIALTYGGEFTLTGGVEKPITPTNIQVVNQSTYGCAEARPVRAANELLFVQRDGRKVRAMAYQALEEGYLAPDIALFAEHLTTSGISAVAYQAAPDPILWIVRNDGVLVSVTYDSAQEVNGWAQHETDGLVESVACIPSSDGSDEVWIIVKRTVDGTDERYIERLSSSLNTDCALTATGASSAVWGGFAHLEGCDLDVIADGVFLEAQVTVTAGSITLPSAATSIEAGLHYTSRVKMLDPEMMTPAGSSMASNMRVLKIVGRFLDTARCRINGTDVVLDGATGDPFTGLYPLENLGWDFGQAEVVIEQVRAEAFHLVAVIREFVSNKP